MFIFTFLIYINIVFYILIKICSEIIKQQSDVGEQNDEIRLHEDGWKDRYYRQKLEVDREADVATLKLYETILNKNRVK